MNWLGSSSKGPGGGCLPAEEDEAHLLVLCWLRIAKNGLQVLMYMNADCDQRKCFDPLSCGSDGC